MLISFYSQFFSSLRSIRDPFNMYAYIFLYIYELCLIQWASTPYRVKKMKNDLHTIRALSSPYSQFLFSLSSHSALFVSPGYVVKIKCVTKRVFHPLQPFLWIITLTANTHNVLNNMFSIKMLWINFSRLVSQTLAYKKCLGNVLWDYCWRREVVCRKMYILWTPFFENCWVRNIAEKSREDLPVFCKFI